MAITKDYYANAQGYQLRDFMKEMANYMDYHKGDIYTLEEGFFLLNAVKYKIRAGLKKDNSFKKDMEKYKDYRKSLEEIYWSENMIDACINDYVNTFHKYDGQKGGEFVKFIEEEGF